MEEEIKASKKESKKIALYIIMLLGIVATSFTIGYVSKGFFDIQEQEEEDNPETKPPEPQRVLFEKMCIVPEPILDKETELECHIVPVGSNCFDDSHCGSEGYCRMIGDNPFLCKKNLNACYFLLKTFDSETGEFSSIPEVTKPGKVCYFFEYLNNIPDEIFSLECLVKEGEKYVEARPGSCNSHQ